MTFVEKTVQFARKHRIDFTENAVLVGVSGGADSIVLLDVLRQFCPKIVVAHCNFQLRGEASDGDELFVKNVAETYHLPFVSVRFDTETIARERSVSVEMAARDLRYDWFERQRVLNNCDYIAVAHHANDQAETVLMNVARGSGIAGLCGMRPQNECIVRPLLHATRAEIEQYASENSLKFRTDATNADTIFRRNFVRHELVPKFEQLNPQFVNTVAENCEILQEVKAFFDAKMVEIAHEILQKKGDDIEIDTHKLLLQPAPKTVLYQLLKPYNFNRKMVENLFSAIGGQNGTTIVRGEFCATIERGKIVVTGSKSDDCEFCFDVCPQEISQPIGLKIELLDFVPEIERRTDIAYFDADKVGKTLTLRHWHGGDLFVPFGMNGTKKVSDFFIDQKFSNAEKRAAWLLTDESKILWIVGHRADGIAKIGKNTKRVLKISLVNSEIIPKKH